MAAAAVGGGMGVIHVDVPDPVHRAVRNIKNNDPDRPDTIEECAREAVQEYVDRYWAADEAGLQEP